MVKGGSVLAIKFGLGGLPPVLSAGMRFTAAGLLLLPFVLLRKGGLLRRGDLLRKGDLLRNADLIRNGSVSGAPPSRNRTSGSSSPASSLSPWWMLGIAGLMSLAYALFYSALDLSLVSRSALFVNLNPFYVALLAGLFLRERLTWRQWAGMAVAFGGVVGIEWHSAYQRAGGWIGLGDQLLILSGLAWASQAVLKKYLSVRIRSATLTLWEILPTGLVLLLYGTLVEGWGQVRFCPSALWSLAYLIVPGTLVAFLLFNWVLGRADASVIVPFSFVIPVTAFGLGVFVRGEPMQWDVALGIIAVGLGLLAVKSGARSPAP